MKIDPDLKSRLRDSRRVLISCTPKLGDCIHTLPALRVIRSYAPNAQIIFLASDLVCPLLQCCVDVDETISMGIDHGSNRHARRKARLVLIRRLFGVGFDLHVDFHPGLDHTLLTTFFAGIKSRIGINSRCNSGRKTWLYDTFSTLQWSNQLLADFELEQLVALGLRANVPPLGPGYLKPLDTNAYQASQPYIHVAPFASEGSRELPPAVLAEALAQVALAEPGYRIVISCAPVARERFALQAVLAALPSTLRSRLDIFNGTLDTAALTSLIAGATLHIGCDSGTAHIAVLTNTPSVSWFLNHESLVAWAPRGTSHSVLISAMEQSRASPALYGISAATLAKEIIQAISEPASGGARWLFVKPD